MQTIADMAKRLILLDADFHLGGQPINYAYFLLMGRKLRDGKRDRLVIHTFTQVKEELRREIALFYRSVPRDVHAVQLSKMNSRLRKNGKPAVSECGTQSHFRHLIDSIKVFMRSHEGKDFKVFMTCSQKDNGANAETHDALRAGLRATAYTTNTDAQRSNAEMREIDVFFSKMQWVSASSTIDVGLDSIVHFPFIIAITCGGTSKPEAHIQAMYRISRILKMDFTLLWYIGEPMPKPEDKLSNPNDNLALNTISGKQAWHRSANTGAMPMHPKLVEIWIENSRETHWNQNEHAVYVRETLKRNPCYTIIAPCDIKLPDGVLAVTPLEIDRMHESYTDASPESIAHLFSTARDVALEISEPLARHRHALDYFRKSAAQQILCDPGLSQRDAEQVVLLTCAETVEGIHTDPDLAKLDASTLESCLLDTWKVIRFTGMGVNVDEAIITYMYTNIDKYVLAVASLKGHLATEQYHMSLQLTGAPKAHVGIYNCIANKVRLIERVAGLLNIPQLVPASADHVILIPDVIVNRINRLLRFNATPSDHQWMGEVAACTQGISDRNAMRFWSQQYTMKMLASLFSEVGNCEMVTEHRPLRPAEQEELVATMLKREGLVDGEDVPTAPEAVREAPIVPNGDTLEALFTTPAEQPPAANGDVERGDQILLVVKKASEVVHFLTIGFKHTHLVCTRASGVVAMGAARIVQQNDTGQVRTVISAGKEEQRKRRNQKQRERRSAKRPNSTNSSVGELVMSSGTGASESMEIVDPLEAEQAAAAAYNAQHLGEEDCDDDASIAGSSVSTASRPAGTRTPEEKARDERKISARREALRARNEAAEAAVAGFKDTEQYNTKLAAAKRRLTAEFPTTEMVEKFDNDEFEVKECCPFMLMKWNCTLRCKPTSPFSCTSELLGKQEKQVLMRSLLNGYREREPNQHEMVDADDEEDAPVLPLDDQVVGQLRAHTLEDGFEAGYELYPLEKTTKLLAVAKGCTDAQRTNIKELFNTVVNMPIKTRTEYKVATIVNPLESLIAKGTPNWATNTLKLPVTYRPGNKLVGVSRSYASYPSNQRFPNILRVALLGAQLHDMDIATCHPTCIVVGILLLGLDPQEVWPIGMEYVQDRCSGIASGLDEKRFQQRIVTHYQGKIDLDDAKEMILIAMNQGSFEWYLQKDHGVVTREHATALLQFRKQTLRVRELFLQNGDTIFGTGNFETLRKDIYTNKKYLPDSQIYTAAVLLDDNEKGKRSLFAIGLHTIERKILRLCIDVAREMELVPFSSIFDGLQLIHPSTSDWVEKLDAYRQECHRLLLLKFRTDIYLIEKPFYLTGVAHPDGECVDGEEYADPRRNAEEVEFGKMLQRAYRV